MKILLSCLLLSLSLSWANCTDLLRLDFTAPPAGTGMDGRNFAIVSDPDKPENRVLKITRVDPASCSFKGMGAIPEGRNVTVRFRARPGATNQSSCGILLKNFTGNTTVADVRFDSDNIISGVAKGSSHFGMRSSPEEWQEIVLEFKAGSDQFDIFRIYPDGKKAKGNSLPVNAQMPIEGVVFATIPASEGKNNVVLIDDFSISYDDNASIEGRANVLLAANDTLATVSTPGQAAPVAAPAIQDGETDGESAVTLTLPAVIEFELPESTLVSSFRLYGGNLDYFANPSGMLAVTEYKLEGLSSASGQYRELFQGKFVPALKPDNLPQPRDFFAACDFSPLEITKLRLTLLDSNDTGKRADPNLKPAKSAIVREVELYTANRVDSSRRNLNNVLEAEYRLPVYRDQKTAQLYALLDPSIPEMEVELSFKERHTNQVPVESRRIKLKSGENIIPVDLSGWDNGEYRTVLRASGKDAPVKGEFARLLRLNRITPAQPSDKVEKMDGRKMFFPDGWYFESQNDLAFGIESPEIHRAGREFYHDNEMIQLGGGIGFDRDGRLVVSINGLDREWNPKSLKQYHIVKKSDDWNDWELRYDAPELISTPAELTQHQKISGGGPSVGYSFGSGSNFRFYDPEKDGPVKLDEMVVQYVGYKPVDWGVVKPQPQSTWLMWPKNGEILLLQKKPFLIDNIASGEFEEPTNSNDNFAGQWLSPDGSKFFYVRGRLLKRYAPFVARYDNLWQIARILTVFSTSDGINWEQNYFALPNEKDVPTSQHYGASIYSVPAGNGLMIAYGMPYSAREQQYYCELYYSWDGREWKRFADQKPWIPAGLPGDWNHGNDNLHNYIVEKDGKTYHQIGWACMGAHFSGDILYSNAETAKLSGKALEKRYGNRDLTKWPYFAHYGSYDNLAQAMKKFGSTTGVFIYRNDGWFPVRPEGESGSFITRPVSSAGSLTANAVVAPDGFMKITLLDDKNLPIPGFQATFSAVDNLTLPIFPNLPKQPFKIKTELKGAKLYSLNFM